jgi:hypothetical protein
MVNPMSEAYDASSDFSYASESIACVLYTLGYEPSEFGSVSFDEVIERIRSVYAYKPSNQINNQIENYAVYEYIKSLNILLTRVFRRSYFDLQISAYELSNV